MITTKNILKGSIFDPDSPQNKEVRDSLPTENAGNGPKNDVSSALWITEGISIFDKISVPIRYKLTPRSIDCNGVWGEKLGIIKKMICQPTGTTIIIRGAPGVGKTQLAVEAMRYAAVYKHVKSEFTSVKRIMMRLKATFKLQHTSELDVFNNLLKIPLLVIDEYDWIPETETSYCNDTMFTILQERYDWGKDTILTSNRTREEFKNDTRKGAIQLQSRVCETGGMIDCDGWTDRRIK